MISRGPANGVADAVGAVRLPESPLGREMAAGVGTALRKDRGPAPVTSQSSVDPKRRKRLRTALLAVEPKATLTAANGNRRGNGVLSAIVRGPPSNHHRAANNRDSLAQRPER